MVLCVNVLDIQELEEGLACTDFACVALLSIPCTLVPFSVEDIRIIFYGALLGQVNVAGATLNAQQACTPQHSQALKP